jgi:hypothetical protein
MTHITQVDTIPFNNPYFRDGTEVEEILKLINDQERPIKIYRGTEWNNILVIDKDEKRTKFLVNLIRDSKEKVNKMIPELVEILGKDKGIWLFDLENEIFIYDYQKKEINPKSSWGFYSKEEYGTALGIDSEHQKPIRIYNSSNKTSLYWSLYLVNKYFHNPLGNLADEFGTDLAIKFCCRVYNIEPYSSYQVSLEKIMEYVQIWEKERDPVLDRKYLITFNSLYQTNKEKEEILNSKKEIKSSLVLSKNGEIYLSDLNTFGIVEEVSEEFFPIVIDIVLDPRITSGFLEDGKIVLITSIELSEKDKKSNLDVLKTIADDIIFMRASSALLPINEGLIWKNYGGIKH